LFPVNHIPVQTNDSLRIYWSANQGPQDFTVELSPDGGATWQVLSNNVPHHLREFSYKLPNTNVGNYKVKVSRNGTTQQAISDDFAANNSFNITFDSQQCPGSLKINWPTVNNATAYNIYIIESDSLKNVG